MNLIKENAPVDIVPTEPKKISTNKVKNDKITKIIRSSGKMKSFLVADLETILIEEKHTPYAVGVMEVEAGSELPSKGEISWWYSEDEILPC